MIPRYTVPDLTTYFTRIDGQRNAWARSAMDLATIAYRPFSLVTDQLFAAVDAVLAHFATLLGMFFFGTVLCWDVLIHNVTAIRTETDRRV